MAYLDKVDFHKLKRVKDIKKQETLTMTTTQKEEEEEVEEIWSKR